MQYAVEVIVTTHQNRHVTGAAPVRRLPRLHDTIEEARAAGKDFLEKNGSYMASKGPNESIAMFQVVDDSGDIVIAPDQAG